MLRNYNTGDKSIMGGWGKENNFILSNNYFERKFLFYFERKFLFLATIISWSPCEHSLTNSRIEEQILGTIFAITILPIVLKMSVK